MSSFQKRVEDFVCEKCGRFVAGSGYTNHCPNCLWSKHVDISPGDRAQICGGMMEPRALEGSSPDYSILHHCIKCGYETRNKVGPSDNMDRLLAIAKNA